MKKSELKKIIKEELLKENKLNFSGLWKDLDSWAKQNKYPAWRHQKKYIKKIAPKYGIPISEKQWGSIFAKYDKKKNAFQFQGWDIDEIPWIEKQVMKLI